MANVRRRFASGLSIATLFSLMLGGCGGGGDSTATTATVATTQTVLVRIVDSKRLALVADREISVDLSGATSKLADLSGNALASTLKTTTGLLNLTVAKGVSPTGAAPIDVSVVIRTSGYSPATRLLHIDSSASVVQDISVVSIATDSNGSLVDVQAGVTGNLSSGTVTAGIVGNGSTSALTASVAATTFAGLSGFATPTPAISVTIDANTGAGKLVGSTWVPAANGPVSLVAIAQSPQATESLSSFPSGMIGVKLKNKSGTTSTASMVRVDGYASFNLTDSGGTAIEKLSEVARFKIEIPLAQNDDSGKLPQIGSTVDLVRYDSAATTWSYETTGTITAADTARGMGTLEFSTDSLGTFAILRQPSTCGTSVHLTRAAGDTRALNVTVLTPGFITGNTGITGSSFSTSYTPDSAGAVFVTLPGGINVVGQAVIAASGSCPRSVDVTVAAPKPAGKITLTTREACTNGASNRPVSTSVSLLRADQSIVSSVQTDATGGAHFDYVEVGQYILSAVNPRSGSVSSTPVSVADGLLVDVPILFSFSCN